MLTYIAGAGAMGCRFGYHFVKNHEKVILIDGWKEHIDQIRAHGLKVEGDHEDCVQIPIYYPNEVKDVADCIILFTKAMQLETMLQNIQHVIGPNTKVLCLLNGLGHEDVIEKYVSKEQILMGVTVWTAGLVKAGTVLLKNSGTINLQSFHENGRKVSQDIVDLLNRVGLNASYDEDVLPSIYRKACVNGTMNATCAIMDCTIGEFFASQNGISIVKALIQEFVSVANALHVSIAYDEMLQYVLDTANNLKEHYPSMQQDLIQNHRRTEIDYINGVISKKGKQLHIPTPYCDLITDLIHAKEDILKI